ncbi:amidohydrolase family protein [Sinorhizobium arboris]|uniref:amidohydrolase family protein n=1 Tax=Sinorhizobium arboris TaxID=76745 RepID=UPI000423CEAC|nr:amidohydrolase family protein [Sinorhizobium arboris]
MSDDLPIIDAHHHFWDPVSNNHPWLSKRPLIPFRYGDYSAICRPFLADDYDRVSAGHNVIGSITMEGEWDPADPIGETAWIDKLSAGSGRPLAHVAHADLRSKDIDTVLARLARFPIVRSIRQKPAATPDPRSFQQGRPGSMSDPAWQRGFARLAAHGLMFDLQVPWWHLIEAIGIAERYPDVPIILNHTGLPADRSAEGLAGWRSALRDFARVPHVAIKISGLGLRGRPWRLEDNRPIILDAIDMFGPERCMFASNFPVDGLCGSFDTIFRGFKEATRGFDRREREAMFAGNAARIYRVACQIERMSAMRRRT